jgi:hypothetical protein
VFGLSMANHPLTWFLAPGVVLFVLAVEPGILERRRFILTCAGVALAVAALLYLELPLRAGPFRAPLVYGRPETLIGFWLVALGLQFAGDVEPARHRRQAWRPHPFGRTSSDSSRLFRWAATTIARRPRSAR